MELLASHSSKKTFEAHMQLLNSEAQHPLSSILARSNLASDSLNDKTDRILQISEDGQQLLLGQRERGVADVICWAGSFKASSNFP